LGLISSIKKLVCDCGNKKTHIEKKKRENRDKKLDAKAYSFEVSKTFDFFGSFNLFYSKSNWIFCFSFFSRNGIPLKPSLFVIIALTLGKRRRNCIELVEEDEDGQWGL